MSVDERIERSRELYERAVFGGDSSGLATAERELNAVEADLALARGRILHARFLDTRIEDAAELPLFERAVQLYQQLGDVRGEADSLFWVGCFHQVVRTDADTAVPSFERSCELATQVGDKLTMSYALRHLGYAEHQAGRHGAAQERLEESLRLRRELGFLSGVAANQVALAYLAAAQNHRDDALALLDEAGINAKASAADAILRQVEEARADLF
jgi:tetratricopeptide (TPR) repeat protein